MTAVSSGCSHAGSHRETGMAPHRPAYTQAAWRTSRLAYHYLRYELDSRRRPDRGPPIFRLGSAEKILLASHVRRRPCPPQLTDRSLMAGCRGNSTGRGRGTIFRRSLQLIPTVPNPSLPSTEAVKDAHFHAREDLPLTASSREGR